MAILLNLVKNCAIKVNLRTRNRWTFQHRCAVGHIVLGHLRTQAYRDLVLFWLKLAFLMSDNQISLQSTHDLLSDDGRKITFVLIRAAAHCTVAY